MELSVVDIGLVPFKQAFQLQNKIHSKVYSNQENHTLILCEHPHTITLGRSAKVENIKDHDFIKKNNMDIILKLNRGGDVTYHGPGQLMGYLIADLRLLKKDIKWFIDRMQDAVIKTAEYLNVDAHAKKGMRGVWVGDKKLASFGIGVRKWVTMHGLGLNVNTNLSFFDIINPCGLDIAMTSLKRESCYSVSMEEVKGIIVANTCSGFGFSKAVEKSCQEFNLANTLI